MTLPASEAACTITTRPLDLQLWHERLCHHNSVDIQKLISGGLAIGISLSSSEKRDPICEPCLAGKMHSSPFPSTGHRASAPLELIHTDLCGPLSVSTPEGYRYWCVFIDDHTRYRVVVLLRRKSDTFTAFKQFKALAENQLDGKSRRCTATKGGNTCPRSSTTSATSLASSALIQRVTGLSKTAMQSVQTERCWRM